MQIKKANACISLIVVLLFLVHCLYQDYAYLNFLHQPEISAFLGFGLLFFMVIHVILAISSMILKHDSLKIEYPALNKGTLLQRITGVLLLVLTLVHMNTFKLVTGAASFGEVIMLDTIQVLFFAAGFLHIALSFDKALITLGFIVDRKKDRIIKTAVSIICALLFLFTSYVIVTTQNMLWEMFRAV